MKHFKSVCAIIFVAVILAASVSAMAFKQKDYIKTTGGFDKHGNTIEVFQSPPAWFFDGIEETNFKWEQWSGTVARTTVTVAGMTPSEVFNGEGALSITSAAGGLGLTRRSCGMTPTERNIGIEMFINLWDTTKFAAAAGANIPIWFEVYDGTNRIDVELAYSPATTRWYVSQDSGATWTSVLVKAIVGQVYHYVKLVFNLDELKYKRLYVDDDSVDLSAYVITSVANPLGSRAHLNIQITGTAANTAVLLVDDVRITYMEP